MAESGQRLERMKNQLTDLKQKVELELQDARKEKESDIKRLKKYVPFTELTRVIVEEFVKRINVDRHGQIEIIWNFNDDFLSDIQRD